MRGQRMIAAALAAGLALSSLGGCACPPQTDFGKAYTIVNRNQILNPDVPEAGPVMGMDGIKSERAMDNYHNPPAAKDNDKGLFLKLGSASGVSSGK